MQCPQLQPRQRVNHADKATSQNIVSHCDSHSTHGNSFKKYLDLPVSRAHLEGLPGAQGIGIVQHRVAVAPPATGHPHPRLAAFPPGILVRLRVIVVSPMRNVAVGPLAKGDTAGARLAVLKHQTKVTPASHQLT
eukprot:scaffold560388_cov37-Prasinocladus_malaysianus.AAC.2